MMIIYYDITTNYDHPRHNSVRDNCCKLIRLRFLGIPKGVTRSYVEKMWF